MLPLDKILKEDPFASNLRKVRSQALRSWGMLGKRARALLGRRSSFHALYVALPFKCVRSTYSMLNNKGTDPLDLNPIVS